MKKMDEVLSKLPISEQEYMRVAALTGNDGNMRNHIISMVNDNLTINQIVYKLYVNYFIMKKQLQNKL